MTQPFTGSKDIRVMSMSAVPSNHEWFLEVSKHQARSAEDLGCNRSPEEKNYLTSRRSDAGFPRWQE
jgi:hypothetical protein